MQNIMQNFVSHVSIVIIYTQVFQITIQTWPLQYMYSDSRYEVHISASDIKALV